MKVAVRGDAVDAVEAACREAAEEHDLPPGLDVRTVDATGGDTPVAADLLVVAGETGRSSLATTPSAVPRLPTLSVDGPGPLSVPRSRLAGAVAAHARGDTWTAPHPVLEAVVDGERAGSAVADVSLMTAEPARISEYAVAIGVGDAGPRGGRAGSANANGNGTGIGEGTPAPPPTGGAPVRLDSFRADGVVVATPLGSAGYARDAGGPIVAPGTGLAVVPVAPFATDSDAYVVRADVTLSVERDDTDVVLLVDDREARTVRPDEPVRVSPAATFPLVHVP